MLLKRTFFTLFVIFLTSYSTFSQKIFRDGYIIKNPGEQLNGLIEYKAGQDVPTSCIFKWFDIAVEITYNPGDIKAFGYFDGSRYESKKLDGKDIFLDVMISGYVSLYRRRSKYFIQKGQSGITELKNGSLEYTAGGELQKFDGLTSFLKYITEGKTGNIKEKLNIKTDVLPIIAEYNKGSGKSFIVFNREYSEEKLLSESFRSGGSRNSFGVLTGINIYSLKLKPLTNVFVPAPEPEISPAFGLTFERIISRINYRLSLRADLMFMKQNFYSYSENAKGVTLQRDDAFFEFTGIKLPLMLQYSFSSGKIIPYVNGGFSYQAFIRKDYDHIRESENYNHEIFISVDHNLNFYRGEIAGALGTGLKIRLMNDIKLSIQGRMEIGPGFFNPEEDGYKNFNQISLQPTFMVGIMF